MSDERAINFQYTLCMCVLLIATEKLHWHVNNKDEIPFLSLSVCSFFFSFLIMKREFAKKKLAYRGSLGCLFRLPQ